MSSPGPRASNQQLHYLQMKASVHFDRTLVNLNRYGLGHQIERTIAMDEIKGIARVKFLPGKVEEWKRLTEQAVEIVRTRDSGTLQYEIFFNEDESEAVVFERYRDADAALEHFANISHLMEPIMATATVTGEVLGTPNAEMRRNLSGDQPKLFEPWLVISEETAPTE